MKILVDTNVLVRLSQPDHVLHHTARSALKRLQARGDDPCIVPQIIYEYWAVCTRPIAQNGLAMTVTEAAAEFATIRDLFTLFRDERAILQAWEGSVVPFDVKGKTTHDARLVAAMERHGLSHILTLIPTDFRRFTGITILTLEDLLDGLAGAPAS